MGLGEIWVLVTSKLKLPVDSLTTENIICNNMFYIKLDIKHKKATKNEGAPKW